MKIYEVSCDPYENGSRIAVQVRAQNAREARQKGRRMAEQQGVMAAGWRRVAVVLAYTQQAATLGLCRCGSHDPCDNFAVPTVDGDTYFCAKCADECLPTDIQERRTITINPRKETL